MSDATAQNSGLSLWGILCILVVVGLNTVLTVGEIHGSAVTVTVVGRWLPAYGLHLGLGCLIIGVIYYHQLRWERT